MSKRLPKDCISLILTYLPLSKILNLQFLGWSQVLTIRFPDYELNQDSCLQHKDKYIELARISGDLSDYSRSRMNSNYLLFMAICQRQVNIVKDLVNSMIKVLKQHFYCALMLATDEIGVKILSLVQVRIQYWGFSNYQVNWNQVLAKQLLQSNVSSICYFADGYLASKIPDGGASTILTYLRAGYLYQNKGWLRNFVLSADSFEDKIKILAEIDYDISEVIGLLVQNRSDDMLNFVFNLFLIHISPKCLSSLLKYVKSKFASIGFVSYFNNIICKKLVTRASEMFELLSSYNSDYRDDKNYHFYLAQVAALSNNIVNFTFTSNQIDDLGVISLLVANRKFYELLAKQSNLSSHAFRMYLHNKSSTIKCITMVLYDLDFAIESNNSAIVYYLIYNNLLYQYYNKIKGRFVIIHK